MVSIHFLVFLGVLSSSMFKVNACMCSPDHPQQDFCDADFVVKLYVEETSEIREEGNAYPRKIKYAVSISKVYKSTDAFQSANTTYLMVPGTEWHCKLDLEPGKEYVITGRVYRNRDGAGWHLYTTMCDFNKPYSALSVNQETYLNNTYSQNCQCRVKSCHPLNNHCIDNVNEDECLYVDPYGRPTPINVQENIERYRNQYCAQRNNRCHWRGGQSEDTLLQRLRSIFA